MKTNKWWMTTDVETWEVRSKNTPAITAYRHRCSERQQNESLRDYNFNYEMSQNGEKCPSQFPGTKRDSLKQTNKLVWLTVQKLKDIFTFRKLEANVFISINGPLILIDYQNSWQLIYFWTTYWLWLLLILTNHSHIKYIAMNRVPLLWIISNKTTFTHVR